MKIVQADSSNERKNEGRIYYSNMIGKAAPGVHGKSMYLYEHDSQKNRYYFVANSNENEKGRIVMFDASGELLISQVIEVYKGKNTIELSTYKTSNQTPHLIAVYIDEQLAFMQKLAS